MKDDDGTVWDALLAKDIEVTSMKMVTVMMA